MRQMERPLDTLLELQQALDELHRAQELLGGIPDWMRDLHEEHSERKGEIDALAAAAEEAAAENRSAEAEARLHQEKLKTYQQQISQVRNQREYGALLQEMDAARTQIKELEEQALAALERQEEALQQRGELQEGFRELDERYAAELEKWEAEKPEVAKQVETLEGRVAVLRERLPPRTLGLYERMLERHDGRALAPIRKVERTGRRPTIWSCGVCNYRVRPQSIVEISNSGSIVYCDGCKRILYLEEAES